MTIRKAVGAGIAIAALSCTLFAGAAVAAVSAGGGSWDYGTNQFKTWSNFNHNTKIHRSTAQSNAATSATGWTPARTSSNAWVFSTLGGNKAFWDTK